MYIRLWGSARKLAGELTNPISSTPQYKKSPSLPRREVPFLLNSPPLIIDQKMPCNNDISFI